MKCRYFIIFLCNNDYKSFVFHTNKKKIQSKNVIYVNLEVNRILINIIL